MKLKSLVSNLHSAQVDIYFFVKWKMQFMDDFSSLTLELNNSFCLLHDFSKLFPLWRVYMHTDAVCQVGEQKVEGPDI